MGRGSRSAAGGGRGGRGGRRGPGGGASGRTGRPGQPAATAPVGDALLVELCAAPEFHEALKGTDCPAKSHEASDGATPLGTCELELADWSHLGALIGWFRDGLAADPQAELSFSPKLTKQLRASVHGTATAVGLGALGTSSRGLGEERRVVVLAKERAERALPALDAKQDHKAFWVWRWALQQGLQVSRDEVAEMVHKDVLPADLQAIWVKQSAQQKAVEQLCAAAAAGDTAAMEAALAAQPGLLSEKIFNVQTGVAPLHVAAREGQMDALQLLLDRGADLEMKDGHGWTALMVARKFEQSDVEGVLLRAGARDPDKGKSILDQSSRLPRNKPAARSGGSPAAPVVHAAAASAAGAASAGSVASSPAAASEVDSAVSVCGTDRDIQAASVGSNVGDYADSQYQGSGTEQGSNTVGCELGEEDPASAASAVAPGKETVEAVVAADAAADFLREQTGPAAAAAAEAALEPDTAAEAAEAEAVSERLVAATDSLREQAAAVEAAAEAAAEADAAAEAEAAGEEIAAAADSMREQAAAVEAAAEAVAVADAAAEAEAAREQVGAATDSLREQAEAVAAAAQAAAEVDAAAEAAAAAELEAAEEEAAAEEAAEEETAAAESAAGTAEEVAIRAFEVAVAAAEAAEWAAEEAESMGGTVGTERAAAFRKESAAAVAAAAAAAVAVGDALDDVMETMRSGTSMHLTLAPAAQAAPAGPQPASDLTQGRSLPTLDLDFDADSNTLSTARSPAPPPASSAAPPASDSSVVMRSRLAGEVQEEDTPASYASVAARPAPAREAGEAPSASSTAAQLVTPSTEASHASYASVAARPPHEGQQRESGSASSTTAQLGTAGKQTVDAKAEEERHEAVLAEGAQAAVGAAAVAVATSGTAAAAAGRNSRDDKVPNDTAPVPASATATVTDGGMEEGQTVQEAAVAAAADLHAKAAAAAEQAAAAAKGAAAAASEAASAARAGLEARLPEWSVWVQEHPGSVMAGAGVAVAAVAAVLLFTRRW
ncbi:hypothetical protein D9Q98_009441 [Chlorella vulgaris]|uniref:Uncharacterized protein n=1 Tax=Chlorella vulgaris TaxID=3077 RepID=A0A9D4TF64_CHLVU|nr:hypothetical protein D9Q98_009441 [Chlorella vulgaris]